MYLTSRKVSSLVIVIISCMHVKACRHGWFGHGHKCYILANLIATWDEASNVCKVFQSKLAEPRTANEQSFLVSTISNLDHHGGAYWIGVTDANNEGQYKYASDGTNLTITPWGHHEGGHDNAEDCVELDFRTGKHGEWADYPCGAQKYFVCEQLQGGSGGSIIG